MTTVEIDPTSVNLKDLLANAKVGEEILLTNHKAPVAKIVPVENPEPQKIRLGLWKELGGEFWMAPDFDEPLEDFREYMP